MGTLATEERGDIGMPLIVDFNYRDDTIAEAT